MIFSFPDVSLLGNVNSILENNEANLEINERMFSFSEYDRGSSVAEDSENDTCYLTTTLSEAKKEHGWAKSIEALALIPQALNVIEGVLLSGSKTQYISKLDTRILFLGAYLLPFGEMAFIDKKGKTVSLMSHIIGTSLKYKKTDVGDITLIMENCRDFKQLITNWRVLKVRPSRLSLGLLLRRLKSTWPVCLVLAVISDILSVEKSSTVHEQPNMELCREIYQVIIELNLDGCWRQKPILNGNGIAKALNLKNGPMIGKWVDEQFRWMLDNPDGSKEECVEYLKQCQEQHSSEMNHTMTRLTLTSSKRTASQASLQSRK